MSPAAAPVSGNEPSTCRPNLQLVGDKPCVGMADSAIDRSVAWTEKLLERKNYKQDRFAACLGRMLALQAMDRVQELSRAARYHAILDLQS